MNYEKEIKEIFNIDLWELKLNYIHFKKDKTDNQKENKLKLIYSNEIVSSKLINFFLSYKDNIDFFINISNNLFFNSNVNIYELDRNIIFFKKIRGINIFEKELFTKTNNLLSIENKKNILLKLYMYADF